MKIILIIVAMGFVLSSAGCSSPTEAPVNTQPIQTTADLQPTQSTVDAQPTEAPTETQLTEQPLTLTTSELKAFTGKNGNPAYIAINGVIYDVTNVPQWRLGMHQGFEAGRDFTIEIEKSPHGITQLRGIPTVGTLIK